MVQPICHGAVAILWHKGPPQNISIGLYCLAPLLPLTMSSDLGYPFILIYLGVMICYVMPYKVDYYRSPEVSLFLTVHILYKYAATNHLCSK